MFSLPNHGPSSILHSKELFKANVCLLPLLFKECSQPGCQTDWAMQEPEAGQTPEVQPNAKLIERNLAWTSHLTSTWGLYYQCATPECPSWIWCSKIGPGLWPNCVHCGRTWQSTLNISQPSQWNAPKFGPWRFQMCPRTWLTFKPGEKMHKCIAAMGVYHILLTVFMASHCFDSPCWSRDVATLAFHQPPWQFISQALYQGFLRSLHLLQPHCYQLPAKPRERGTSKPWVGTKAKKSSPSSRAWPSGCGNQTKANRQTTGRFQLLLLGLPTLPWAGRLLQVEFTCQGHQK